MAAQSIDFPFETATGRAQERTARSIPIWIPFLAAAFFGGLIAIRPAGSQAPSVESFGRAAESAVRPSSSASLLPELSPSAPAPKPTAANAVLDAAQRITRIEGKDARAVLDAYCSEGFGHESRTALEVRPTQPFRDGVLLGVFVEFYHERALWIRRNPRTRQWFAGDGFKPLEGEPISR